MTFLQTRDIDRCLDYYGSDRTRRAFGPDMLPEGWQEVLGVDLWGRDGFIRAVAKFQAAHGLTIDGRVGKRTARALARVLTQPGEHCQALTFCSETSAPDGLRIIGPHHPDGFNFAEADPGRHLHGLFRRGRPTALILHDSVTRTTSQCFEVLTRRRSKKTHRNLGLGTQLMLGPDGTLYQCVPDLNFVTYHAPPWSPFALGLDVVGLLEPRHAPHSPRRRPKTSWAGRGYIDYTKAQKAALPLAVKAVCELCNIPFVWPCDFGGAPATRPYGEAMDLRPTEWAGVMAHAQITKRRWDGNRALEVLAEVE